MNAHQFELKSLVSEALAEQAAASNASDLDASFSVIGESEDSLLNLTASRVHPAPHPGGLRWGKNPLSCGVRDVFHAAVSLGLIAPGLLVKRLAGAKATQFLGRIPCPNRDQ